MATVRQVRAARRNIRKAQSKWRSMSSRQHALAQPQGRTRKRPGTTGRGAYYRIEVRPRGEFVTFRTQDVGDPGHIQRLAGRRASGSWATASWLISKADAHLRAGRLVADSREAKKLLGTLGSAPVRILGDRFRARGTPNIPERSKPTAAQRRPRRSNIRKAQASR